MWKTVFITIIFIIVVIGIIYACMSFAKYKPVKPPLEPYKPASYRVIVSLSTLPSRVKQLQDAITEFDKQSLTPDLICVNLPLISIRENCEYPEEIKLNSRSPIIVNRRTDDYGPLTKLLPTLYMDTGPDDIIVTIDDDQVYHKDFLRSIVQQSLKYPDACVTFGGWNYGHFFGFVVPLYTFADSKVDILQGYRGVAYKRRFFDEDFIEESKKYSECFTVDDINISFYLRKRNIPIYKVRFLQNLSPILSSKGMSSPLGDFNLRNFVWGKCIRKLESDLPKTFWK